MTVVYSQNTEDFVSKHVGKPIDFSVNLRFSFPATARIWKAANIKHTITADVIVLLEEELSLLTIQQIYTKEIWIIKVDSTGVIYTEAI